MDGGFLVSGTYALNKLFTFSTDSMGNMLWANTCGGGYHYQEDRIRETPDGGVVLCATERDSLLNGSVYLRRTGSSGFSGCYDSVVNPLIFAPDLTMFSWNLQPLPVTVTNDGTQTIVSSVVPQDSVICVSQVGLQEINIQTETFFPNPVQDKFFISTNIFARENNIIFSLYDLQGRKVLQQQYDKTGPINLSDVHNGYYVAVLRGKEKEMRRKVMVQRQD
jgi:hypothetical protein